MKSSKGFQAMDLMLFFAVENGNHYREMLRALHSQARQSFLLLSIALGIFVWEVSNGNSAMAFSAYVLAAIPLCWLTCHWQAYQIWRTVLLMKKLNTERINAGYNAK